MPAGLLKDPQPHDIFEETKTLPSAALVREIGVHNALGAYGGRRFYAKQRPGAAGKIGKAFALSSGNGGDCGRGIVGSFDGEKLTLEENHRFPNEPVMPGVLLVEAMSQCGALYILNMLDKPENYSTYFVKIDKVIFHKKVVPGDTLIFKIEQSAGLRHGIAMMKGYIFVGEKLVVEAQFVGQIIKNKE